MDKIIPNNNKVNGKNKTYNNNYLRLRSQIINCLYNI